MTFLSPWALLLGTLALPLVLLYFLRVRRQPHRVSSVMLWAPTRRDQRASALFQRLQLDPLLLLQALALLLLVLALARPTILVPGRSADRLVLVLDTSASMQVGDVPPSRFRVAQARAAALVDEAGSGAEVMVIEAGAHPVVRVPFTRDHARARSGVWALEARDLPNRLDEAVRTALTLVPAGDPRVRVQVLTDGAFDPALTQEFSDPRVRWVAVGGGARNVAITGFAVRKSYYGAYDYQAFVSLTNFADEPVRFPLTLTLDDRPLSDQSVALGPGVKRNVIVPFTHQGGGRLRVEAHAADDLAVDNTAVTILPAPAKLRVVLVSPGNLFLEKALRTDPQVVLETRAPGDYAGGMLDADVVVLDGTAPPKIGPGRFVLVHALPGDVPIQALGQLEEPTVLDWDRAHPVMRFVDLSKVSIESALRVRPLAAGRTLLEAVGGPLIYLLEEPQRKVVFVGFDLFKTDLPLRVAFPLILANSLRWLHPVALEGADPRARRGTRSSCPWSMASTRRRSAIRPAASGPSRSRAAGVLRPDGPYRRVHAARRGARQRIRGQPRRPGRVRHPPAAAPDDVGALARRRDDVHRSAAAGAHARTARHPDAGIRRSALRATPGRRPVAVADPPGGSMGPRAPRRERGRARLGAHATPDRALDRPTECHLPPGSLGQCHARRAGDRLPLHDQRARAHESRRAPQGHHLRPGAGAGRAAPATADARAAARDPEWHGDRH